MTMRIRMAPNDRRLEPRLMASINGGARAAPITTPSTRPAYWPSESQKPRRYPLLTANTTAMRMTRSMSVNRKIAPRFPDADQGVAVGQLLVTDEPRLGLVDNAVDFHHASLAPALAAVGGERQPGFEPGVKDSLGLVDRHRLAAPDEGDLERRRHQ